MNENQNTPYANLDPNLILGAIETLGFACNGSLLALNSYENRVYQIGIVDSDPLIAKFYRPNRWSNETILEEHQFTLELVEHEIPVVAPLVNQDKTLHEYEGYRFALFPRKSGRALELDSLEQLEWMGRFIGRVHAVGACRPFEHRLRIDVQSHGYQSYQFLMEQGFIPDYLKPNYSRSAEIALQKIEDTFKQLGKINYFRIHGDIHAGNVLWSEAGPHIVDFDDCVMGPAVQDIWMLLSGNEEQVEIELEYILRGYRQFHNFNFRELKLVESMRTLRMFHHSAWLAKRWQDPAFPMSFPYFNTPSYWQQQINDLNEQIDLMEKVDFWD